VSRDPRYDILFEPVRIGPVVAKNRFFQVPHCNGMGHAMPEAHAAMRATKAEGGWAVVSTEECEIHPSSDLSPYIEARLPDDALYQEPLGREVEWSGAGIEAVTGESHADADVAFRRQRWSPVPE
jgi:hypothetical protein